jgi:hypothetical protein
MSRTGGLSAVDDARAVRPAAPQPIIAVRRLGKSYGTARGPVVVAQGYAKGTIFMIANPVAAVCILWEVFPQAKPASKDEETALAYRYVPR